jgi:CubicO group peptidase (beta-lactamase class C family)
MQVIEVLEQGIADGTQIGAQLFVSRDGKVVADCALGDARAGVPMTTDTLMNWFSMTKAVTALAVAQQWEAGAIEVDVPAAQYVPEFGASGKHEITLRHLLTHTAGIPNADGMLEGEPWRESRAENLARIYAAGPEYPAGTRAGYHAAAGMTVLGEVVARVTGLPYEQYVRESIFEPLGAPDCWVGMREEQYEAYGDRIGIMHATSGDGPQPLPRINSARSAATPMPGAGGRGPMNQLGRVFEALASGGAPLVSPVTLAAIAPPHRDARRDVRHRPRLGTRSRDRHVGDGPVLLTTHVRSWRPSVVRRVLRSRARGGRRRRVQRDAGPRASLPTPRRDQQRGICRPRPRPPPRPRTSQAVPDRRSLVSGCYRARPASTMRSG